MINRGNLNYKTGFDSWKIITSRYHTELELAKNANKTVAMEREPRKLSVRKTKSRKHFLFKKKFCSQCIGVGIRQI